MQQSLVAKHVDSGQATLGKAAQKKICSKTPTRVRWSEKYESVLFFKSIVSVMSIFDKQLSAEYVSDSILIHLVWLLLRGLGQGLKMFKVWFS